LFHKEEHCAISEVLIQSKEITSVRRQALGQNFKACFLYQSLDYLLDSVAKSDLAGLCHELREFGGGLSRPKDTCEAIGAFGELLKQIEART